MRPAGRCAWTQSAVQVDARGPSPRSRQRMRARCAGRHTPVAVLFVEIPQLLAARKRSRAIGPARIEAEDGLGGRIHVRNRRQRIVQPLVCAGNHQRDGCPTHDAAAQDARREAAARIPGCRLARRSRRRTTPKCTRAPTPATAPPRHAPPRAPRAAPYGACSCVPSDRVRATNWQAEIVLAGSV